MSAGVSTSAMVGQYKAKAGGSADHRLEEHLQKLGLIAISSYKLWCRRNGFSMELEKSDAERLAELDTIKRPKVGKLHDPQHAEYIKRIAAGKLEGKSVTEFGSCIRKLFADVNHIDGGREALLRLILHVEKHGNVLSSAIGFKALGQANSNQVMAGLSQLICHHSDWIRQPEEWYPGTRGARKPAVQFRSLAAHLLAKYPVPPCLNAAWFESDTQEAAIQQEWYKRIGRGQNIRTAKCLPFRLTKRAAHIFMTMGHVYPAPLAALRWAQIRAINGDIQPSRHWEINSHERIRGRDNADFWTSIIHFLLNNPMLERNYIGAVIDYIHYTKFERRRVPQPHGSVRMDPPVHPNFAIKGRSINKLIREVDDWHEQLSGEEYDYVEEWEPSSLRAFALTEYNEALKARIQWTIQELCTSALLQLEGRMMHHCVGSYVKKCISGEASIWSLRSRKDEEDAEQHHILTIAVDNKKHKVTQALGKFNLKPQESRTRRQHRKTDSNYRSALNESPRILALWRKQESLGY